MRGKKIFKKLHFVHLRYWSAKAYWFVKSSLALDIGLLKVSRWPVFKKFQFIYIKYIEILCLYLGIRKFNLGKSFVNLFGRKVFYDSPYGIAGFQSMLVRHQKMILENNITDVRTVLDIGANVGFFSMMIKDLFPDVNIYAIEPIPQIFRCLKKNLSGNKDKVFDLAISDKNGEESMSFNECESAISHVVDTSDLTSLNVIRVKTRSLDDFVLEQEITNIDILKVDTENYEAKVLEGAKDTLKIVKYLHIEIGIEGNNNYTFTQINGLLFSDEYNFQLLSFRNFTDRGDGPIPVGDFLYRNLMVK